MRKTPRKSFVDVLRRVTTEVESSYPSDDQMIRDLKTMNLKIRLLSGDVFGIPNKDIELVKSLWKIGKIQEIVSFEMSHLDDSEKEMLYHYLDDLQYHKQGKMMSSLSELSSEEQKNMRVVELEIFRENKKTKRQMH